MVVQLWNWMTQLCWPALQKSSAFDEHVQVRLQPIAGVHDDLLEELVSSQSSPHHYLEAQLQEKDPTLDWWQSKAFFHTENDTQNSHYGFEETNLGILKSPLEVVIVNQKFLCKDKTNGSQGHSIFQLVVWIWWLNVMNTRNWKKDKK